MDDLTSGEEEAESDHGITQANTSSSIEKQEENAQKSKKRKRLTRDKIVNEKRERLLGENYERLKKDYEKYSYDQNGNSRKLGARCNSQRRVIKKRQCSEFSEQDREDIFNIFWKKMTSWVSSVIC